MNILKKYPGVYVAAGFSLRSFFLIISQGKACGYILNANGWHFLIKGNLTRDISLSRNSAAGKSGARRRNRQFPGANFLPLSPPGRGILGLAFF
jgi:hypothetical protein